jgi:hypothetical protein
MLLPFSFNKPQGNLEYYDVGWSFYRSLRRDMRGQFVRLLDCFVSLYKIDLDWVRPNCTCERSQVSDCDPNCSSGQTACRLGSTGTSVGDNSGMLVDHMHENSGSVSHLTVSREFG